VQSLVQRTTRSFGSHTFIVSCRGHRTTETMSAQPLQLQRTTGDGVLVLSEVNRELFVDPRIAESALTARLAFRGSGRSCPLDHPFGLDYDPPASAADLVGLEERVEATLAARSETTGDYMRRLRAEMKAIETADSSSDEEEFVCSPVSVAVAAAEEYHTQRGVAETFFLSNNSSQPHLIAMCQGLVTRTVDPYPGTYLFDMENDDLLKAFPQKALFFPVVRLLKEEVVRLVPPSCASDPSGRPLPSRR
jgi:hypothetical protein